MKYLATTSFGMEGVLKNECVLQGFTIEQVEMGMVVFSGSLMDMLHANLTLRTAERIFWVLGEAKPKTFDQLYDFVTAYPFEDIMSAKAEIIVNAKSYRSTLYSLRDIQRITKKAIVDRYFRKKGLRYLDETGAQYSYLLRIEKDQAYLLLDTTGEPLHKRGYRQQHNQAPLRENFAAGLLLLSRYFGKGDFCDPLCGSGTIAIEAAMIAMDKAPGLERGFQCEEWKLLDEKESRMLRHSLRERIKPAEFKVMAYDNDPRAITMARRNAKMANVKLELKVQDLRDLQGLSGGGTLVTNMPYGERMGTAQEILVLEELMAHQVQSLDTWRLGILSGSPDLSKKLGRRANKVRKFYNGQLETWFYQYDPTKRW
ncbi:MAG: class I SAM-dependent RNA methyltransferase [Tissierellia bacterium]|nr:class I SAM-dependent RNA methyltransferase [Tissierellia bacterium]